VAWKAPKPDQIKEMIMGTIAVHEFITLDGVIDNPSWTFDYSFDPRMGDAIGAIMGTSKAILLGPPDLRAVRSDVVDPDHGRRSRGSVHERDAQVHRFVDTGQRRLEQFDHPRVL
jgi:hypothetical protein